VGFHGFYCRAECLMLRRSLLAPNKGVQTPSEALKRQPV